MPRANTDLQWKMPRLAEPLKDLYLVAGPTGLKGLYTCEQDCPYARDLSESKILSQTVKELQEYFQGTRTEFTVPLAPQGTEFQMKVWAQLRKIPFGQTISYRQLASQIQNEKACRAVGTANGKNPLSILIPCHRVIAADGTLGGYSGGLEMKKALLSLESRKAKPRDLPL